MKNWRLYLLSMLLLLSFGCNLAFYANRDSGQEAPPARVAAEPAQSQLRVVAKKLGIHVREGMSDQEIAADIDVLLLEVVNAPKDVLPDEKISGLSRFASPEQGQILKEINDFARKFKGRRVLPLP